MNLYQVVNSSDLEEILTDHCDKLVNIMFASKQCPPCREFKPRFVNISKKYQDDMFIYVDINNFDDIQKRFLKEITRVPVLYIYYDNKPIVVFEALIEEEVVEVLNEIHNKIASARTEAEKEMKNEEEELNTDPKILMLKKLFELKKKGVKLTKCYNMESDLEEMEFEYNIHTNPTNVAIGNDNDERNRLMKEQEEKLEKVKQLQSMIQMQQEKKRQLENEH